MTILLSRTDVEQVLDVEAAIEVLRAGFLAPRSAIPALRVRTDLPGAGSATALLPGLIDGIPAYTVKANAKFPGATPALRGVVCLHDLTDGRLLAVLDSGVVTAWRTGLAAALATHLLAGSEASSVGVIGAGAQAEMVVHGLSGLRRVDELVVFDIVPDRAAAFGRPHGWPVRVAEGARAVAESSQILIIATWSRAPLLDRSDLRPGTHVTALGADEPGKVELTPALLTAATTVVDDRALAGRSGALANAGLGEDAADATLGEILHGEHPGRDHAAQITVYAPVGLPWQDLAIAWPAYRTARRQGTATTFDFLA